MRLPQIRLMIIIIFYFRFYTDEDFEGPESELQAIQEEKDYCGSENLGDSSTSEESDYPDDEEEEDPENLDMYK